MYKHCILNLLNCPMSHSVLLSNSFCQDEYPENQGCEFTNQLNQPLDLSYGKWGVNLSEIIYEPYFWSNIRKSDTYLDVSVSKFTHYHIVNNQIYFQDISVMLWEPVTDLNHPVILKVTIETTIKSTVDADNDIVLQYSFHVTKDDSYDVYKKPISWKDEIKISQKYLTSYGPLTFNRPDAEAILSIFEKSKKTNFATMGGNVKPGVALFIKHYEFLSTFWGTATRRVNFDVSTVYIKAKDFVNI